MKILVTGATGFIGKNLIKTIHKDFELFIVTRERKNIANVSESHEFIFKDNIDELTNFIKDNKIEGIIHLATKYIAEHKSKDIKDLILSNLYFSTAILDAAVTAKVKWFINIGTIWQNYEVPDYSDIYNPVNLYAATKQAFITLAKYYTEISDLRFCTLKLCDTYGPNDTRRKVIDLFKEISQNGESLDMSPGEQLIDIVHVDKVINEIKILIKLISQDNKILLDEYVVTSGKSVTLKELARLYEEKNNVKLRINWGNRPYRKREVMKPYRGNTINKDN